MARRAASKAFKHINRPLYLRRRQAYYEAFRDVEKRKSAERSRRRKSLPEDELAAARQKHREAQARYREKNRTILNAKAKIYYRRRKMKAEKAQRGEESEEEIDEEAEWIRLSAMAEEISEEEWLRKHGRPV
ncbi:hypothetical protein JR316_0010501 [Psilocybe cubensis]|uniref:Uncharacterized protein n=2 Tax=Psilocybe cubensis TaxID=181762 RepID=A0ACB8GLY7_PSICU|nr:hypothetical protein JR316_0010501 [Psilocybe cubensis]KAH9476589.1 hypothetical protein JR316_0010501 [Psilocybe cubensis]